MSRFEGHDFMVFMSCSWLMMHQLSRPLTICLPTVFWQMIDGSDEEFMLTNLEKTFFLGLCKNPDTDLILVSDSKSIQYAENNSHLYLGMGIVSSNDIVDHIKYNISHRKISKNIMIGSKSANLLHIGTEKTGNYFRDNFFFSYVFDISEVPQPCSRFTLKKK